MHIAFLLSVKFAFSVVFFAKVDIKIVCIPRAHITCLEETSLEHIEDQL